MASNVRLRSEGIRVLKDRIVFTRFSHFRSDGSDNAYNFDVGNGSLVAQGDVTVSGNLTITSPGILKELGVASDKNVVQTVRIADTGVAGYTPFRAAADGSIYKLSTVYYQAEGDATDTMYLWLSDGAGIRGESVLQIGPNPGGIAVGEVDTQVIVGGPTNPNDEALRRVSRGSLRWLEHLPVGLTVGNDCTVVIEIEPAAES